ncbi:MAG TPA: hypothetical protein VGH38_37265 [Bryobacteraceae bacterium]|jgi:hypothetical protein
MNIGSPIAQAPNGVLNLKTAILLIDRDLGFMFWLGRELDKAGYEAFPAKSVPDALKLIAELHLSVGLVILSDSLPGAANFVSTLRHTQKRLRILSLVEDADEPNRLGADALQVRLDKIRENSRVEWLQLIQKILSPSAHANGNGNFHKGACRGNVIP